MDLNSLNKKAEDILILIVDDLPKNLQLLGTMLSREGYKISVATSGKEAISRLSKTRPDLILMDIMMPEMDGYQACEIIKTEKSTKHIPVIFISAKRELFDKLKGFQAGGSDYITKPFQFEEVLARVRAHVELKLARDIINEYNQHLESMVEQRTKALVKSERESAFSLFMQGIVHNLKNPLTSILGSADFISMLLNKAKNLDDLSAIKLITKDIDKYSSIISGSAKNLSEMVNSLMSKSRSDKTESIEITDLNKLLQQDIDFLEADLRFKNEVLKEIDLSETSLQLEIVPSELSQVFQNLVYNALDALNGDENGKIQIRSGLNDTFVWFSVADNGPGIPKDSIEKIFDPFFTTKSTQTDEDDQPKGTGLGLYICQNLVSSYNGKLRCESELKRGTTFTASFPLSV